MKTALTVGNAIGRLVIAAGLGATLVISVVAYGSIRLAAQQNQASASSLLVKDAERIGDASSSWFIVNDLVYGSAETYLIRSARRQGNSLNVLLDDLALNSLTSSIQQQIYAYKGLLLGNQDRLRAAELIDLSSDIAATNTLLNEWDKDSASIVALIDSIETALSALVDARQKAVIESRSLFYAGSVVASLLYIAGILSGWIWVRRSIVSPLVEFSHAANSALGSGRELLLPDRGPVEVMRMARATNAFIVTLEQKVVARTIELAEREVALMMEVDSRREAEEAATVARQRAEEASSAKSEFLANMSHEIRTPLNGVLGMAELLSTGSRSQAELQAIATIMASGKHLLGVVNGILDFSRLESAEIALNIQKFDLHHLNQTVVEMFRIQAGVKSVDFDYQIDESVPATVSGDEMCLRQTLINILGNAFKFTPEGHVEMRVSVDEQSGNRAVVRWEIEDTGIGVQAGDIDKIFEPFSQADSSTTREYGGTGLGLSICRSLVERMGGEIGVRDAAGSGSTFWFTMPLEVSSATPESAQMQKRSAAPAVEKSSIRVLVAEDEMVNQRVVIAMLEKLGCQVDLAQDGQQAVDFYKRGNYALVLMDWHMPVLDGLAAARQIREWEATLSKPRFAPILALTANAFETHKDTCLQAGMDDFLTKPVSMDMLSDALQKWVHPQLNSAKRPSPDIPTLA